MAQENMGGWMEYAREYAKTQREKIIEKWVGITIEYRTKERQRVVLFRYDLPRNVYERRQWVVRWRQARLLCQYPKENVQAYFSYYDRRTGLSMDFGSLLSRLSAAKTQITIARRKEQEYLEYQRKNNMFFIETEDETLAKFRRKLQSKIEKYAEIEREVILSIQNARSQS